MPPEKFENIIINKMKGNESYQLVFNLVNLEYSFRVQAPCRQFFNRLFNIIQIRELLIDLAHLMAKPLAHYA